MKKKKQSFKEMMEMIKEFPIKPMIVVEQHSDWTINELIIK